MVSQILYGNYVSGLILQYKLQIFNFNIVLTRSICFIPPKNGQKNPVNKLKMTL